MGMGNWAKDGLDAYLAVTGEKRAQDKADEDLEHQKQTMQLLQNQDKRAGMTALLTNQVTQQSIARGAREEEDATKWDNLLFEEGYKKEVANPHTVTAETIKDPAQVAASKYVYENNLKTVAYVRGLPTGMNRISMPMAQMATMTEIPDHVKFTATNIFAPAAKKRSGQESTDPITGKTGILTGNMGHVNIERDANGESYISGDMEVKDPDGTIRYAPFTNGTDDPKQPVKRIPLAALEHEANSVIQGTDDAQRTGADPTATITKRKLKGSDSWPLEVKKKFVQNMLEEDKNLKTRESSQKLLANLTPDQKAAFGKGGMRMIDVGAQLGLTPEQTISLAQKSAEGEAARAEKYDTQKQIAKDKREEQDRRDKERQEDRQDNIRLSASFRSGDSGKDTLQTKRDISTRLREAQRSHQAALKTNDPDAINESINLIESLNADAKDYGVIPQPVPSRPFTSAENDAIKAQAIKNLEEQRGRAARVFGTKPSVPAINQEVFRLKKTLRPGSVSFADAQSAPAAAATAMPPAEQHNGKTLRDTETGKRYQSNGSAWVEVR